jgi:hypothetical protein
MLNIFKRNTTAIAIVLAVVMLATRGHHAASLTHLPDASWAIFFMLGFYLRNRVLLPVFLTLAALIDYVSITKFGTSDFCVTAAYVFLVPAYSAMWLGGSWYASRHSHHMNSLPLFAAAEVVSTTLCEVISSGSFYFLGGRFADTSLSGFASRLAQYFPSDLASAVMYLGLGALIHVLIVSMQPSSVTNQ